ncbi:hypothetical protein [Caldovatus aquaticus]|uniref:Uncharacterized protein n=1 Tax=Caldovatus aquaticus TaxID=2865671 RepID=A0ABS7EYY9_9PROT|nr:hypothetical protein [Caldovatus aquaticus]MBW8268595.1 hypothetical protein [Caldovatus aquaticus]
MSRIAALPFPGLVLAAAMAVAACAPAAPAPPVSVSGLVQPTPRGPGAAPGGERVSRDALVEACRREAERVVLYRDRGQQMRTDEGESRVGVQANIPTLRAETDRLAQQFERDRMVEECVRRHGGEDGPGPQAGAAPSAAGAAPAAPAPAPASRRPRRSGS